MKKYINYFFNTLNTLNEIFLVEYNEEKLNKSMKEFTEKLNYARFLIKTEDFHKILDLHNQISSYLIKFYGQYDMLPKNKLGLSEEEKNNLKNERLKEFPVLDEYIKKKTDEFLKIILPYLQIE